VCCGWDDRCSAAYYYWYDWYDWYDCVAVSGYYVLDVGV
jgi:hypothetical protein